VRLSADQILKPGAKLVVEKIDLDDPKNARIKERFEKTKQRQREIKELRNLPFENLRITI
jgi:hypothetical protein